MLIEAARGGHSGVVNLLLRQPRFTEALRNQILASRQAAAVNSEQQQLTQGRKRARSHPHQVSNCHVKIALASLKVSCVIVTRVYCVVVLVNQDGAS